MPLPYYIESTTKLWIKDHFAPYGSNVYYVQKVAGYTPNDLAVFDFIDDFNDESINTTKWFTDGIGTIQESGDTAYVACTQSNSYPRFVSTIPLYFRHYMVEYDVKVTGAVSESCRMGYTSHYVDGSELANWFLFFDSSRYLRFWTRINGVWALRWSYTTAITLNTWYKIRVIETVAGVKLQLLNSSSALLAESGSFRYDYKNQNSIYFGQRTTGDSGYWDNFKIRRYATIEPTVTVTVEGSAYKVKIKNNTGEELRDYQVSIPASSLGTLTSTTSLCIDQIYKTPLKNAYHDTLLYSTLNIPDMTRDVTNNNTLTMLNTSKTSDRFNANNAVAFNGVNARGVIAHNTSLDIFNTNVFTTILWLRQIGDYSTTWAALLSKGVNLNANRWNLHIISNEVGFWIYDADSTLSFANSYSPININDGQWHMVAFVRNGSNILVYKDGEYIRTYALVNISNFSNTYDVNIGCRLNNGTYEQYYNGEFGEVLLYNVAYTNTQILNYYNLSKYKYVPMTTHGNQF